MDKMFNILALMSVPLCWVLCRAWVQSLNVRAQGAWTAQLEGLRRDNADLRQRVETLETIVTSTSYPLAPPPPPSPPLPPAPREPVPSTALTSVPGRQLVVVHR